MCYAYRSIVRIFGALLLIVNVLYVENFEQYSKVVKSSTTNDNGEKSDGSQVDRASLPDPWFPKIYKTQINAKVETSSGRSAPESIYPTYSPSSSSTKLTGKRMAYDRFLPSGTTSGYNQPQDRLYDYEPHVTYPPSVPLNQQKNPVNHYLKAPSGPITDDDKTDSYIGPVSPQLLPPTNTKGNRKDDITDNKSDMKDNDKDNDDYNDEYNDDDTTTEMNESDELPPSPPPTRGIAIGTPRVAKYSYYYLARTVWYVPLYALLWYVFYVAYLVLKSISRHKVTDPTPTGRIQRSLRDLPHKEAVQKIDKLTVFVMNQIEDFKDKYL